jgi:hypothetical protein
LLPATDGLCGACYIFGKSCEEILSVDDWLAEAPPKHGFSAWKHYRSAKGLARSWFGPPDAAPADELLFILRQLFPGRRDDSHRRKSCSIVRTIFSEASQGTTTLPCWALPDHQKLAISIEAKADEPFGDQDVGEYYESPWNRSASNLWRGLMVSVGPSFNTDLRHVSRQPSTRRNNPAPTSPFPSSMNSLQVG